MADEKTVGTIVLVGIIFQLILAVVWFIGAALFVIAAIISPFSTGYPTLDLLFQPAWLVDLALAAYGCFAGILSIIYVQLWLQWRQNPCDYKTKFIVSGVISMIFAGVIGGLFALIGGLLTPDVGV